MADTANSSAGGATGEDLDARYGITEEETGTAEAELERLERAGQVWQGRLEDTAEGARLWADPVFRAAIEAGRASRGRSGAAPAGGARMPPAGGGD